MNSKKKYTAFYNLLFIASGIALYFYFLFFIKPTLYYTAQEPVFYFDQHYINSVASYPGGLLNAFSALLSQFYYFPRLGAFVPAILFVASLFLLRFYLRKISHSEPGASVFLPMTLLLVSHSSYEHSLVVNVSFLFFLIP